MLNEGDQIHNFISSSGSDFLTSYGSGSGSTRKKATVPTVPVPQHYLFHHPIKYILFVFEIVQACSKV